MRIYELITISPPTMSDAESDQLIAEIGGLIQAEGAELVRLDRWGKKRLAHPLARHQEGLYLYALYKSSGEVSATIERKLRLRETILRLQTVRVDQDLARAKVELTSILPKLDQPETAAAAGPAETEAAVESAEVGAGESA
jgi:small subunit ribosomal protein S6